MRPLDQRPLRVALSTTVGQRGRSGVATYLFGLIEGLLRDELRVELILFGFKEDRSLFARWLDRCRWVDIGEFWRPAVRDIIYHQFILPWRLSALGCDVVHIPSYRRVLAFAPCRQVLTIHDCASFRMREKYGFARNLYTRLLVVPLARRAAARIAVSQNTATDIERFYGVRTEDVAVIPNGIDHDRFRPNSAPPPTPAGRPYFLYVARFEHPAKNHVRLIEAFELFCLRQPDAPHELLLPGADWHGAEVIHERIRRSPVCNRIRVPGFVATQALPGLYAGATALVFPSLFEGFGLPPVEAMACGCPVISSSRGALDEIIGQAARRIDPEDPADIALALGEMLIPAAREIRKKAGYLQAARFNWGEVGRNTSVIYRRVAAA